MDLTAPRQLVLELFRAQRPEDPFGFRAGPEDYLLRHEGGVVEALHLDWRDGWMQDLGALQRADVPLELRRRLGERLREWLARSRWREQQRQLASLGEGEHLELTLRAQAAELLILPWELLVLEGSGLHLGAHPGLLLRYEWPGTQSVPDALPGQGHRRVVFAWSEAGGGVGLREHLDALEPLLERSGQALDPLPNLRLNALVERLQAARDAGAPHRVLHLLCHGELVDGSVGLALSQGHVSGPRLAERLAPFADTLRVVVLSACMGGRAAPGSHLGAIAQHLHRAGFQAVVASRTPLSILGSVRLSEALHDALQRGASPEQAFLAARKALHAADARSFDWAALQLFAHPADASEGLSGFAALRKLAADEAVSVEIMEEGLAGLGRLPDVLASPDPDLARRHAALVTAAFLRAVLAAQPKGQDLQAAVDALLQRAGLELVRERPGRDHASESERLRALTGSPLRTPFYQALRTALLHPDAEQALVVEDEAELERRFLLAWRQLMNTEVGEAVRRYLGGLEGERQGLVRRLVVSELAGWGEREVFGNRRSAELEPGESSLPLGELFVQPQARSLRSDETQPVLELLDHHLRDGSPDRVLLLRGPFGAGKTLTARSLVARMAARYLGEQPGPRWLPVFLDCATDLDPRGVDEGEGWAFLDRARRRAWRRQLSQLVADLRLDSPVLNLPWGEERQIFVLDGLDEWSLDPERVAALLRLLLDEASDARRFVLVARPGLPLEARAMEHVSVLDLLPFDAERQGQVTDWLARWSRLTGAEAPTRRALRRAKLLPVAQRPGLLVMLAKQAAALSGDTDLVALHERFLAQLARGKLDEEGGAAHRRLYAASGALLERLRAREELPADAERGEAMLWLMGRFAWELSRARQRQRHLSLAQLRGALREELDFRDPDDIELVVGGLLLALQASPALELDALLFGHAPFLTHLVARFWANRLRNLIRADLETRAALNAQLLGGRLMEDDGAAWRVLMEIVSGEHAEAGLGPLFTWTRRDQRALAVWAESTFEDEALVTRGRFRDDQRAFLREAALAIRCSLPDVPPFMLDEDALRSLLAWFWVRQQPSMVVARRCDLSEFQLKGVSLAGADLRETDCHEAELSMSDLSFSQLDGADLRGAKLGGAELIGAQLSGAVLASANLEQANLSTATLDGADMQGVEATTCELEGAMLAGVNLQGAVLIRSNLSLANLMGADLRGARLQDSHLVGADLSMADLRGADLRRVDLAEATLDDAQLEGAVYSPETSWPEGFDPEEAGASPG